MAAPIGHFRFLSRNPCRFLTNGDGNDRIKGRKTRTFSLQKSSSKSNKIKAKTESSILESHASMKKSNQKMLFIIRIGRKCFELAVCCVQRSRCSFMYHANRLLLKMIVNWRLHVDFQIVSDEIVES